MEPETKMIRGAKTLKLKHKNHEKQTERHTYTQSQSLLTLWIQEHHFGEKMRKFGGHPPSPYQSAHPFPEPERKYSRHTHPPWIY